MAAISIGGASGYWGDASHATSQLLSYAPLDYLVYDYLAEVTLSIMARARAVDSSKGYAIDFVSRAMTPNLETIASRGIKVISNAGGMNPAACAAALRQVIAAQKLSLRVAVVEGDDLMGQLELLSSCTEMSSGVPFPDRESVLSANAYLGALPVAHALTDADIVITGRGVDSAVTLGACIAAHGWSMDDFDRLAQGSLAGHLIECGVQATGGNFTDWRSVPGPLEDLGYPIAVIEASGEFTVTKPPGTAGLVSPGTVGEQLLYEIHDPQAYRLPDVVCDFSQVTLTQVEFPLDSVQHAHRDQGHSTHRHPGEHVAVRVSGATGSAPTSVYKVSVTHRDGYKAALSLGFFGLEAADKARAFAGAALSQTGKHLEAAALSALGETSIELIGDHSQLGRARSSEEVPDSMSEQAAHASEIQLNMAVRHEQKEGAALFIQSVTGLGLATPPGMAIFQTGRPRPSAVVRLFSCVLDKSALEVTVTNDRGKRVLSVADDGKARDSAHRSISDVGPVTGIQRPPEPVLPPDSLQGQALVEVPLINVALARSGDKGDLANIGIMARDPAYLPWIWAGLTPERVANLFAHFDPSHVERFLLPGMHAMNVVLHQVLGGGGMASIRSDAQGKAYAQVLLNQTISVPTHLAESV